MDNEKKLSRLNWIEEHIGDSYDMVMMAGWKIYGAKIISVDKEEGLIMVRYLGSSWGNDIIRTHELHVENIGFIRTYTRWGVAGGWPECLDH